VSPALNRWSCADEWCRTIGGFQLTLDIATMRLIKGGGTMFLRVCKTLAVFALLTGMAAAPTFGDECEDVGKLASMLGQIDQQCPRYRLSEPGRKVYRSMIEKSLTIGGLKCAERGRVVMLQDMRDYNPDLDRLAAAGDQNAFSDGLCIAIARYFGLLAKFSKKPMLFEEQR
jgi:hypothetical protein